MNIVLKDIYSSFVDILVKFHLEYLYKIKQNIFKIFCSILGRMNHCRSQIFIVKILILNFYVQELSSFFDFVKNSVHIFPIHKQHLKICMEIYDRANRTDYSLSVDNQA